MAHRSYRREPVVSEGRRVVSELARRRNDRGRSPVHKRTTIFENWSHAARLVVAWRHRRWRSSSAWLTRQRRIPRSDATGQLRSGCRHDRRPGAQRRPDSRGPASGPIALTGPSVDFAGGQAAGAAQPPVPNPPLTPPASDAGGCGSASHPAGTACRRANAPPAAPPKPRVIQFPDRLDRHGSRSSAAHRQAETDQEVAADLSNLVETVNEPEAEISLVEGQTKVIQTAAS